MSAASEEDEWEYHAFRVGRTTRSAEVAAPDGGTQTIEEGIIRFDAIDKADRWLWEEDEWLDWFIGPDGGAGFKGGVAVPHEKLGIIEFPEPMTRKEAGEWLEENPEQWQRFVDNEIESDTTAGDIVEEVR